MVAKELISDEIPPLKTSDTGLKAINWMEEFKLSHLPIVNNKDFLGLITETDVLDMNSPEEAIGSYELSLEKPFVYEHQHIFEVFNSMARQKLSVLPVLDENHRYLGLITPSDLIEKFATTSAVSNPGSIITLKVNTNDYTLSEISSIVEGNDAKIISMYITSPTDTQELEITLKINKTDISRIIKAFRRYEYEIAASYQENEYQEELKKRYDEFMRYMNI